MAAFRMLYFPPATSHFSQTHLFLPSPPNHRLLSIAAKPHRSNPRLFLVKANAQIEAEAQPSIQSGENIAEEDAKIEAEAQPSIQAEENITEEDEFSKTRLLVQNVPWTCTVDDLRPLFERYGTVMDIEFSMYNKTKNRGLAFVTLSSHEEAVAALNDLEASEFEGRVLKVNWAKPKKEKPSSPPPPPKVLPIHNLFVANLPFQARAKDLKEFFNAENANVVTAEIIFYEKPTRRSAGYGFVSFNTKADAEAALAAFQGKDFMGRPIRVAPSKRFLRQQKETTVESESDEVA